VSVLQVVALALAVVATALGAAAFARGVVAIVRTVRRGGPAPSRTTSPGTRTWLTVKEVLGHGRFQQRPAVRAAHWAVMISFPVLFGTLVAGYGQIVDPFFELPVIGRWAPWEWLTESVAWLSLVGIVWLIATRQLRGPRRSTAEGERASRFFGSNAGQAYLVEGVVLGVVVAVLVLRGLEYALTAAEQGGLPAFDPHFPLTAWYGQWFAHLSLGAIRTTVVVVALAKIMISMAWMVAVGSRPAMGVAWHRFLAVINVWARRETNGRPALGAAAPLRAADGTALDLTTLEDLPEDLALGVGRVEDLTWKGLLDLSTCTECGRCMEACPAWGTGKALSPKLVVTALRDHAYATTPGLVAGPNHPTSPTGGTSTTGRVPLLGAGDHADLDVLSLVGDVVSPEALWDCTTCGACVQQCPVDIEHVDLILDLRRHQVLAQGDAPAELGQMLTKLERRSNPWGLAAKGRMAWAEGLDFHVPVVGQDVEDVTGLDCLFWVGCAGAYDDHGRQVARAVAELLHVAGVSFAVLGTAESCTGDPARRAGNEALFQQLAHAAIDSLQTARATRVVTTCAHCFNTIANEYPELGGHFSVLHHTELLEKLVAERRLVPVQRSEATITYHDPCYLGRHNRIYSPPRALLGVTGATLTEMPRTGERSFCCGGGGARVWMEESSGRRIAGDRVAEASGTGADVIATACPFCTVMLGDAAGSAGASGGEAPVVRDVAEVLLDAVRPAPAEQV
jgi:Fe-S oxidoreductase